MSTMTAAVCDESLDKQLAVATAKINDRWNVASDGEILSTYDKLYAQLTCRLYGDFARGWVWAPSCTTAAEGGAPGGFQFNVSPRAPLFQRPFSPDALYNGLLCYPLAAGEKTLFSVRNKQQTISLEHFADPELAIDSRLRTRLDQRTHLGGGAVNFAGIFWSFEDNEHRFYCVVQAHDEALSRAAFKLIEDNEPESFACVNEYARALLSESAAFQADLDRRRATNNSVDLTEIARVAEEELQESSTTTKRRSKSRDPYTTWYEMFFRNERMREISRLQSEHRARIACLTMKEAGVGPVRCNASDTEMITAVLEHPSTIHSAFNCIEQVDAENRWSDVVYLSNLTSAWAATSAGVAIRASLDDEGVTLFRGKPSPPRFAAEQRWPFIGLPIATGPVYSPSLAVRLANPFTESRTVLWSLKQQPHHMLAAENWRSRKTETWLQWERDCGITSERGVTLKPARVRVVDPTGAAVSQRETIYRKTQ